MSLPWGCPASRGTHTQGNLFSHPETCNSLAGLPAPGGLLFSSLVIIASYLTGKTGPLHGPHMHRPWASQGGPHLRALLYCLTIHKPPFRTLRMVGAQGLGLAHVHPGTGSGSPFLAQDSLGLTLPFSSFSSVMVSQGLWLRPFLLSSSFPFSPCLFFLREESKIAKQQMLILRVGSKWADTEHVSRGPKALSSPCPTP